MRYDASALERLRARIAGAENGWFFAQIAERVSERRKEVGLSQQQLALLTGTTQSAIARLEKGGRPPRPSAACSSPTRPTCSPRRRPS